MHTRYKNCENSKTDKQTKNDERHFSCKTQTRGARSLIKVKGQNIHSKTFCPKGSSRRRCSETDPAASRCYTDVNAENLTWTKPTSFSD